MSEAIAPELPNIGFGTGQLQGHVAQTAVETAIAEGFRLIDTGAIYGNEVEVGEAVRNAAAPRDEIIVITKGAHDTKEHGFEQVQAAFEISLGKLALDYVDFYLIHWPTNPEQRLETWRGMEVIQQSGRARALGVSNYAIHHLEELKDEPIQPAVNQLEFHPYLYQEQRDILEYCKAHDIKVMGYSTYANGQADNDPIVLEIARHVNRSPRHVLTRWSIQHGVTPLVRSSSPAHIADNIRVDDFELSDAYMETLDTSLQGKREFRDPHKLP